MIGFFIQALHESFGFLNSAAWQVSLHSDGEMALSGRGKRRIVLAV